MIIEINNYIIYHNIRTKFSFENPEIMSFLNFIRDWSIIILFKFNVWIENKALKGWLDTAEGFLRIRSRLKWIGRLLTNWFNIWFILAVVDRPGSWLFCCVSDLAENQKNIKSALRIKTRAYIIIYTKLWGKAHALPGISPILRLSQIDNRQFNYGSTARSKAASP